VFARAAAAPNPLAQGPAVTRHAGIMRTLYQAPWGDGPRPDKEAIRWSGRSARSAPLVDLGDLSHILGLLIAMVALTEITAGLGIANTLADPSPSAAGNWPSSGRWA
jgi:hypothetical protein